MFMPKNKEKQKNCLNLKILAIIENQDNKCCKYTTYNEFNRKFNNFEFKKGAEMLISLTF